MRPAKGVGPGWGVEKRSISHWDGRRGFAAQQSRLAGSLTPTLSQRRGSQLLFDAQRELWENPRSPRPFAAQQSRHAGSLTPTLSQRRGSQLLFDAQRELWENPRSPRAVAAQQSRHAGSLTPALSRR